MTAKLSIIADVKVEFKPCEIIFDDPFSLTVVHVLKRLPLLGSSCEKSTFVSSLTV
jgi:hypothetical protein